MVAFLDHDKSDGRIIALLETQASFADGRQLPLQHLLQRDETDGTIQLCINETYLGKLAFADTVAIENDPLRFARRRGARGTIEFKQQIVHHVLHVFNVLLLRFLNADLANVLGSARVDTSHNGGNRRLARILLVRSFKRKRKDDANHIPICFKFKFYLDG